MAVSDSERIFRKVLIHISQQLSKEDIVKLKRELPPIPIYQEKEHGYQIFQEMIHFGNLTVSKRMDLVLLLKKIGRTDLAKKFEEWNGKEEIQCKPDTVYLPEFLHEDGKSIDLSKQELLDDEIVCRLSLVKSDEVEKIDLSGNNVGPETLQCLINNFGNVKYLNLRRCKLNKPELIAQVKQVIANLSNLEVIDLYENNLADNGIESLIPCLKNANHLKKIICGKNKITTNGLEALNRRLISEDTTNFQIEALSLANNKIDKNSLEALHETLLKFPSLKEFDIAHNNLGYSATEIIKCLPKSLEKLSLKNCNLVYDEKDFLNALLALPNLVSLNLGENNLGTTCSNILAPLLQKNKQFEELRLYKCKILSDGMIALSWPLHELKYLTALTLSNNNIEKTGAKALSEALPCLSELTELWLSDNDLHDDGLIILVPALTKLEKLKILALNNNQIKDEGAKELAKPLQRFESLQKLYLYDNMIGDCGIIALLESLNMIPVNLTNLVLNSNFIEETGLCCLINSLNTRKMKNLKELSIHNNSFSGELKPQLEKLSKRHGVIITS